MWVTKRDAGWICPADLKHTHGRHLRLYLGKINAELTPRLQLKERWGPRSNKGLSIYRGPGFSPAKNTYT